MQSIKTAKSRMFAGTVEIDPSGADSGPNSLAQTGTANADTLTGTAGPDELSGLGGDDILIGGAGVNLLDGGDGSDTASYLDATTGVTVSLAATGAQVTGFSTDTLISIERVIGSRGFADVLTGSDGDDVLDPGSRIADAVLTPGAQNARDEVRGGGGNDRITVEGVSNGDILDGGDGNDTITVGWSGTIRTTAPSFGNSGGTTFTAIDGDAPVVTGGAGADTISVRGHGVIDGGAGDDILTVGTGFGTLTDVYVLGTTDTTVRLTGGAGADRFVVQNPVGTAVVTDFQVGIDTIDLNQNGQLGGTSSPNRIVMSQQGADTIFTSRATGAVVLRLLNVNVDAIPAATFINNPGGGFFSPYLTVPTVQTGTSGPDTLAGTAGFDTLRGLEGDDILIGGAGENTLDGGAGSDTASYLDATAGVTVSLAVTGLQNTGFSNDALISIERLIGSRDYADVLTGGSGDDRLDAGSRALTNTAPITTVINSNDILRGGAGNDILTSQGISNGSILDGGDGDDVITASWSATSRQQPFSLGLTYTVYTGVAGAPVTLLGGAGSDRIRAYSNAVIDGGAGDDVITVGAGPLGFRDRPIYTAGSADGSVRITGGSGADIFVLSNPVATAVITDFQVGIDRIDASDSYDYSTNLRSPRLILGQQGADTLIMSYDGSQVVARLVGINAASLGGSTFLDNELGDPVFVSQYLPLQAPYIDPSRIYSVGTEGADTLSGVTLVMGQGGDDVISAGSASSMLGGGAGNDRLTGSIGADVLRGNDGSDVLVGGDGGDFLYGDAGDDRIQGGRGADVLTGGSDPSAAANGADVFVFTSVADSNAAGYDIIRDFSGGLDTIDLSALSTSQITIIRNGFDTAFIFATTADGTLQIGSTEYLDGRDLVYTGTHGVNMLAVGSNRAYLHGSARGDTITGSSGDDAIWGEAGADVLTGGEGADGFQYVTLSDSTAAASDIITDFQTGVDRIDLGGSMSGTVASITIVRTQGSSFLFATGLTGNLQVGLAGAALNGRDLRAFTADGTMGVTMIGSAAADAFVGGTGADIFLGGGGADLLTGGLGADVFRYTATLDSTASASDVVTDFATGSDRIDLTGLNTTSISVIRSGGSSFVYAETPTGGFQVIALNQAVNGMDFQYGRSHGIYLIGSADADVLWGSSLADPIVGGGGNDYIIGGGGSDALFGEGGADTFVYVAASDSAVATADSIFGFVSGQDRIDLSQVRTGASDTFGIAYLGTGSFLFVDLGGNGTNDMLIQLAGTTLLASDIRWSASAGDLEPGLKDTGPDVLPIEPSDEVGLAGLTGWTGRYMLDLDTTLTGGQTGGLHHTPDWYL